MTWHKENLFTGNGVYGFDHKIVVKAEDGTIKSYRLQ